MVYFTLPDDIRNMKDFRDHNTFSSSSCCALVVGVFESRAIKVLQDLCCSHYNDLHVEGVFGVFVMSVKLRAVLL